MRLYKVCNKISLLLHALCSAAGYFLIEAISRHSFVEAWNYMTGKPLVFAYNAGLIFVTSLIAYLFRRRTFWRVLIAIFWLLLGITNGVILANRVTPFTGPDLHLLTDGMAILNKYLPAWGVIIALIVLGLFVLILLALLIRGPKYKRRVKFRYDLLMVVVAVAAFAGITQLALDKRVLSNYFGNIAFAYEDYGYPYCLAVTIFDTGISCPRDYSEKEIRRIEKTEDNLPATSDSSKPNILFLQLESFFDPIEYEDLQMSEDPIPNLRKMFENYSSGYFKVPSVGAGTANTEFEVLTGMNLRYFGPGEYPYKTKLKNQVCESAATAFSAFGYGTHAIHNNGGNFYSRAKVFNNIGFDSFTSKEFMNILQTTENGWSKDDILLTHIKDALDSTEQEDFVFTVSVQGHGNYPTEKVIENPKITVTGAPTEEKNNAWEYYVNQVYEMDQFAGNLVKMMEERGEPTVVVFYGDHLPTMGLEAKDMKNRYLYNTNYVIWDNLGLQKEDRNIPSYQIMADVMDRLGLHSGTVFNYHQQRRQTKDYLKDLELLQYDILYGDQYVYNGKPPITEGHMQMGIKEVTLTDLVENLDETYSLYGTNFTKWSKVYINDEKQESTFLNNTRIELPDSKLKDGDIITVSQVGSSNTIFRTSREYIYMDGKILEYTDEVKEQKNSAKTDGDQQKTENAGQSGEQQDQNNKEEKSGQQ